MDSTRGGNGRAHALKVERGDRISLAYDGLREMIVAGALAPGARIIETAIAERLGVSRTPIRAALQRLEREGYVVVTGPGQQSRMSVSLLTQDDAMELFGVISAVEGLAAYSAARKPVDERLAGVHELRALNAQLLEAAASPERDGLRLFRLDQMFHRRIVEMGAGPRLLALHDGVKPQSERYGRLHSRIMSDEVCMSAREHENIVCAIAAGDCEAAEAAMRVNWTNATRRLATMLGTASEEMGLRATGA